MKSFLIFSLISSLFAGCAFTQSVNINEDTAPKHQLREQLGDVWGREEFNDAMSGKTATVELKDGRTMRAEKILLRPDSTFFTNPSDGSRASLRTQDIKSFKRSNHIMGGLQGIMFGATCGAVLLGGAACLAPKSGGDQDWGPAIGAYLGGLLGGITGLTYGLIHGSNDFYELASDSSSSFNKKPIK